MANWNQDNLVEFEFNDRRNVKKKLRELIFDKPENLKNILQAYEIINSQHTRDLTIQKSLDTTI